MGELSQRLMPPNTEHIFGCDLYGNDLFIALIHGAKWSLYVSFLAVTISFLIGITLGTVSGYFGGLADRLIMGVTEIFMAFPGILLAMTIAAVLGSNVNNIILAITATGWTVPARLTRSQILSLRERDYILAAQSIGAGRVRVILTHILPNISSALIVAATFAFSGVILVESSLSFLGLGPSENYISWGQLLSQGKSVLIEAPHLSLIPGVTIFIVILGINFVGGCTQGYTRSEISLIVPPHYKS